MVCIYIYIFSIISSFAYSQTNEKSLQRILIGSYLYTNLECDSQVAMLFFKLQWCAISNTVIFINAFHVLKD